jgi:hypothetical protein
MAPLLSSRPTSPSARRLGIRRFPWWAGLLLGIGVLVGIQELAWLVFAPWAVGWLPGPKLIGTYGGELVAEQGARYPFLLELEPHYRYRGGPGSPRASNLQGRAQLCTPSGARIAYQLAGYANPWGEDLTLHLEYADPSLSQLNFRFHGEWEGDRLELRPTQHNPFGLDGSFLPNRSRDPADPSDYFAASVLRKDAVISLPGNCRTWGEPGG